MLYLVKEAQHQIRLRCIFPYIFPFLEESVTEEIACPWSLETLKDTIKGRDVHKQGALSCLIFLSS